MARFDSVGMFWQDIPSTEGKREVIRVMPAIPDTGWKKPTSFPNLSTASCISIDCETYDPELLTHGPGWARGKGHLVGVSVGANGGGRWYFPMRHEVEPQDNLPPEKVLEWLRYTLATPQQPKVGANLLYDLGWLRHEGVIVKGELVDVQAAEALLNEKADVNLEALGLKYLNEGKESNLLYNWCSRYFGGKENGTQRANIYRAPPRLVGPYAESDADLPLRIAKIIYPLLEKENLTQLFKMECSLIPLLLDMRFAGVRVNLNKAEELKEVLTARIKEEHYKLRLITGFDVDINSSGSLSRAFDKIGLRYEKTDKGNASFTKKFLEGVNHPLANHIREIRKCDKLRGTFIESYILDSNIGGIVHGQFHPLRGDESGTRSGRFSSSTPNLQNIPSRDDELAPMIRGLFIPDEGHVAWRKYDYSQIEYRFLIHFAVGQGSEEVRAHFNSHPETDYHDMALDLVAPQAGWDITSKELRKHWRRPIKNINFGLIYGMGVDKLSGDLGLTRTQGKELFAAYHKGVPFAKATMDACSGEAQTTGAITTFLGRKSRFDFWEPTKWNADTIPLPYDQAIMRYGSIRRAHTHKALNRRLQGSAADQMKVAMIRCYEAGVFSETGTPRLTVHDELDFSDPGGKSEAYKEMKHIMETALPLRIPVRVDGDIGADWGHLEAIEED
jgi:DNA polymerase I-like protein with 3'-5' exonuclease and polymerase domains